MSNPISSDRQSETAHREPDSSPAGHPEESKRVLPLESRVGTVGSGWAVLLPVRAEQITIQKQTFVTEELVLHRRDVEGVAQVEETVHQERLRVDTEGDVEAIPPVDPGRGMEPKS